MSSSAKATIISGENTITFEGSEEFVASQVEKYSTHTSKSQASIAAIGDYASRSPRELVEEKQPKGHHELVTVFAFYLQQCGQEEFSEADIKRVYVQAGVRPPKVISQSLRDAKNNQDYIESGKKRGTYRLSHHGERTVRFDLPRS